jgi:para-aminobenzoate synthetase/4-amino-4-deoxychorismate lyase
MPEVEPWFLYSQEHLVLLETNKFSGENRRSYLFHGPLEVLRADSCEEVPLVFEALERRSKDHYVAGYFSYELGYCLEDRLRGHAPGGAPLVWLGVFDRAVVFDHASGSFEGDTGGLFCAGHRSPYYIRDLRLDISREDYVRRVERIRRYIEAGDIYQANFTTKYRFEFDGCYLSFYQDLKRKQEVPYSAFIKSGESYVLSVSPELFLRRTGGRISTRPMKGTMARGMTLGEDRRRAAALREDAKNRAENLMIVDLERNDLGRISRAGSVRVADLFTVEKYQTLFQMTSTVTAELRDGVGFVDIFRSLFPSGSVTGAPKIRAMEIIRELEASSRGVYTGAIGFVAPGGDAVFNIPIRTVAVDRGRGEMGVGSGIVYDSDPGAEYEECRLKAEFLLREHREFSLIETMLWDGEFKRLKLHLARLGESAGYFDFDYDEAGVRNALVEAERELESGRRYRVRLLLSREGDCTVSAEEITETPFGEQTAAVSDVRTSSGDVFLYHKTTNRDLYDCEYRKYSALGFFDVIFLNERGEVTEGAISSVFVKKGGVFRTPPVECGLLPGVFRRKFLSGHPGCRQEVLTLDDLYGADEVYLTNSVRGMVRVRLAPRGRPPAP